MAKKKIKVTDAMAAEAEPTFTKAGATKLTAIGAGSRRTEFREKRLAKKRRDGAKKFYQRFLDDGGTVGDWQSFLEWLLEHGDELIAFIAKLISLFSKS